jgi:hypothetical protein
MKVSLMNTHCLSGIRVDGRFAQNFFQLEVAC